MAMELHCANCDQIIEEGHEFHFDWLEGVYCEDCLEELEEDGKICTCGECGEYKDPEDVYWLSDAETYVCTECLEYYDRYQQCRECGDWFDTRATDMVLTAYNCNDEYVCPSCYDRYDYWPCADCGDVYALDDLCYDENSEHYYCSYCYDDIRRRHKIQNYGYKPTPKFKASTHDEFVTSDDPKSPIFLGVELEVDGNYNLEPEDGADAVMNCSDDVYCKHDGSLDNGFEIVTHPATLKYHLNDMGWDRICEAASDEGFRSHDTNTCGLHVHVGRTQLGEWPDFRVKTITNIITLMCVHKDNLVKFTRRKPQELEQWAQWPTFTVRSEEEDIQNMAIDRSASRYRALNLNNRDTIEFRIFKGTLNANTVKATLEMVSNIVGYAMTHRWDVCRTSDWLDIVHYHEYPELNEYVESKGLTESSAPWKEEIEELERAEARRKELIEKAREELKSNPPESFNTTALTVNEDWNIRMNMPDGIVTEAMLNVMAHDVEGFGSQFGGVNPVPADGRFHRGDIVVCGYAPGYGFGVILEDEPEHGEGYDPMLAVAWSRMTTGHDCSGRCEDGFGWFVSASELQAVSLLPF